MLRQGLHAVTPFLLNEIPAKQAQLVVGYQATSHFGFATMSEEHHGNLGVILLGAGIGGFIAILVSLVVCYVKRWCCFAVSQVWIFIVGDISSCNV